MTVTHATLHSAHHHTCGYRQRVCHGVQDERRRHTVQPQQRCQQHPSATPQSQDRRTLVHKQQSCGTRHHVSCMCVCAAKPQHSNDTSTEPSYRILESKRHQTGCQHLQGSKLTTTPTTPPSHTKSAILLLLRLPTPTPAVADKQTKKAAPKKAQHCQTHQLPIPEYIPQAGVY